MPPMKAEAGLEVMEDTKGEWARPVKDGDEISTCYLGRGYPLLRLKKEG